MISHTHTHTNTQEHSKDSTQLQTLVKQYIYSIRTSARNVSPDYNTKRYSMEIYTILALNNSAYRSNVLVL